VVLGSITVNLTFGLEARESFGWTISERSKFQLSIPHAPMVRYLIKRHSRDIQFAFGKLKTSSVLRKLAVADW
jgi:hypothetical protein